MNKEGIIKSVGTLFPTRRHSATKFGVNQILLSIVMSSFCEINRICRISSFTGDGLVRVLLKVNKAIYENTISTASKKPGQSDARKFRSLLLSKNALWLKKSGLTVITPDELHEIYKERLTSETWLEQVKGQTMAGSTMTDDLWVNDILWQLSVFACNLSVMKRPKKNRLKRQERRIFIDWFISVPPKMTGSGYQMEIKSYEHHFYKADWKELDGLIEVA